MNVTIKKEFKVVTVSDNTNSFGLKQFIIVAKDGEAYKSHMTSQFAPKKGDTIRFVAPWSDRERRVQDEHKYIPGTEMTERIKNAPQEVIDDAFTSLEIDDDLKSKVSQGLKDAIASRGKNKGKLKAKCPKLNTYGSAVWQALMHYSNPHKIGIAHILFMNEDVNEVYKYIIKVGKVIDLSTFDSDANALRNLGLM